MLPLNSNRGTISSLTSAFFYLLMATLVSGKEPEQTNTPPAKNTESQAQKTTTVRLSSLDLSAIRQGWGQPQADKSVTGKPIAIAGRTFAHGIGTHAESEFSLDLGGTATRLTAWVGIDDGAQGKGSVNFQVFDDRGDKLWSSGMRHGGEAAKKVDLEVTGRRWITLVADTGGDDFQFDHANWADATVTMRSGRPRIVSALSFDPIAELTIPGKSQSPLATPVRLPFERTLPGPISDWVLLTAKGAWGEEYYLQVQKLEAEGFRYASRSGRACSGIKSWWMVANRRTGQGLALMLAYMGNWTFEVVPQGQQVVVRLATSPAELQPFVTVEGLPIPGALVAEFTGHWDYGAQPIVRFIRQKLLRNLGESWPLVQYNNWYDGGGDMNQKHLIASAQAAAGVGCELFTVDAGWYGEGADADWGRSLGDWRVNRARLPDGLEAIAGEARRLGMKFGLWFEIECADPKSPLAKEHPDWFLVDSQGRRFTHRDVLDFGKPEVLAHVKGVIDDFMAKYRLDYIKMDFNTNPAIENQGLTQANDPLYRHYRGLVELWTYMHEKYPSLIIENCASGSLRQELTSAAFTDTHWVSDNIDNRPNLLMAFGANYLMPPSVCSHFTTSPARGDPMIDLDAQFAVNMMGHLGLSGPIASWDAETRAIAKQRIAEYKRIRPVIRGADVYHLTPQRLGYLQAALYSDASTGRAILFAFHGGDAEKKHTIRLRGLDPAKRYRVELPAGFGLVAGPNAADVLTVEGKELVEKGLTIVFPRSGSAAIVPIEPVN
jgi:alpha-galactosidase